MNKLAIAGFALILIVLAVWQYTRMATELGKKDQANATLKQSVIDGEKERDKLKSVAKLNSFITAKVSKEKEILNTYALKKAHELEILKNENEEIKKWAAFYLPNVIAGKLFDITDNDDKNGLYITADGVINADSGTEIKVRNENLYNYANELKTSLRLCNTDKIGLIDWYRKAGVILE